MSVPVANPSHPPFSSWLSFLTAIPPPPSPREIKDFVLSANARDSREPVDSYRRETREGQVQWCLAVLLLVIASVLLVVILVEEASDQPTGAQMLVTHHPLLPNASAPMLAKWLPVNSSAEATSQTSEALNEQLQGRNDTTEMQGRNDTTEMQGRNDTTEMQGRNDTTDSNYTNSTQLESPEQTSVELGS